MSSGKKRSGAPAPGVFISFADVAGGFSSPSSTSSSLAASSSDATTAEGASSTAPPGGSSGSEDVVLDVAYYAGSNAEVAQLTRTVLKKDGVTRVKALQELRGIVEESGVMGVDQLVPFFVSLHRRLAMDTSRAVREELHLLQGALMRNSKKEFTPAFMRALIGRWWMSMSDPSREVAAAATRAFEEAVPPKKRDSVLLFLAPAVLDFARGVLNSTPESLSAQETVFKGCSAEDAAERYHNVVSSCMRGLTRLITPAMSAAAPTSSPASPTDTATSPTFGLSNKADDSSRGYMSEASIKTFLDGQASVAASAVSTMNPKLLTASAEIFCANMWRRCINMTDAYLRVCGYEFIEAYASMHPEAFRVAMGVTSSPLGQLAAESHKILIRVVKKEAETADATEGSVAAAMRVVIAVARACPELFETYSSGELLSTTKRCVEKFPEIGSFYLLRWVDALPSSLKKPDALIQETNVFSSLIDILNHPALRASASVNAQISHSEIAAYLLLQFRGQSVQPGSDASIQAYQASSALINICKALMPRYLGSILGRNADHSMDRRATKGDAVSSSLSEKLSSALSRALVVLQLLALDSGLSSMSWNETVWAPIATIQLDCIESCIQSQSYSPAELSKLSRSVCDLLQSSMQRSATDATGVGIDLIKCQLRDRAVSVLACPPSTWPSDSAVLLRLFWAADMLTMCPDVMNASVRYPIRADWLTWLLDLVEEDPAWLVKQGDLVEMSRAESGENPTKNTSCQWSSVVSPLLETLGAYTSRNQSTDDIDTLLSCALRSGKLGPIASICRGFTASGADKRTITAHVKAVGPLFRGILTAALSPSHPNMSELADTIALLLVLFGIDSVMSNGASFFAELCSVVTSSNDWFHKYIVLRFFVLSSHGLNSERSRAISILDEAVARTFDGSTDGDVFLGMGLTLVARDFILHPGRPGVGSLDELKPLFSSAPSEGPTDTAFRQRAMKILYNSIFSLIWSKDTPTLSSTDCASLMFNMLSLIGDRSSDINTEYLHSSFRDAFCCDARAMWQELTSFARNSSILSSHQSFTSRMTSLRHTVQTLLCLIQQLPTSEELFKSDQNIIDFTHTIGRCLSDLIFAGTECNAGQHGWHITDTFAAMHSIRCAAAELRKLAYFAMRVGCEAEVSAPSEYEVIHELVKALTAKPEDVALECLLMDAILPVKSAESADLNFEAMLLDSPVPGDILKAMHDVKSTVWRGKSATLLQTIAGDTSADPTSTRVRIQSASVVATHLDNGPDAPHYYTVRVGEAGDREVQSEGHKIILQAPQDLLSNSSNIQTCLLETNIPIASSPYRACELLLESLKSLKSSDGLISLAEGLLLAVHRLLSMSGLSESGDAKAAFSTPRDKITLLEAAAATASTLIRVLGAAIDARGAVDVSGHAHFMSVLAIVRGTIIKLMSCGSAGPASMPNPNGWARFVPYFRIALQLLNSLLLTSWGVGSGGSKMNSGILRDYVWLTFLQPGFYNVIAAVSTLPRLVFSLSEKAYLLGELTCTVSLLVNKRPHPLDSMHKHGKLSGLSLTHHEWPIFAVDSAPSPLHWNFSQQWLLRKVLELYCPMRRAALGSEPEPRPDCCGDGYCVLWNEVYGSKTLMHHQAFAQCLSRLWALRGIFIGGGSDFKANQQDVVSNRLNTFDSATPTWELDGLAFVLLSFTKMIEKFNGLCGQEEQTLAMSSLNSQINEHVINALDSWFQNNVDHGAGDRLVRLYKLMKSTGVMDGSKAETALLDFLSVPLQPSIFSFAHSRHLERSFVSCAFIATKLLNVWYSDVHSLLQRPQEVIAPVDSAEASRFDALVALLPSQDDEDEEAEEALTGGDISDPKEADGAASSSWISDIIGWMNPLSTVTSEDKASAKRGTGGGEDDDFAALSAKHNAREMARRSAHVTMLAQLVGPKFLRELCRCAAASDDIDDISPVEDGAEDASVANSTSDLVVSSPGGPDRSAKRKYQARFEYLLEDDGATLRALLATLRWFVLLSRVGGLSSSGWRCSDPEDESRLREAVFAQKGTLIDVCAHIHDFCIAAIGEFETNLLPSLSRSYFLPAIRLEGRAKSLGGRVSHGVWRGLDSALLDMSVSDITGFHGDGPEPVEVRECNLRLLLASALVDTVVVAPSLVRGFYDSSSNRAERALLKEFIEKNVTSSLVAHEVDSVNRATAAGKWAAAVTEGPAQANSAGLDAGELKVVASRASGETVAVYSRDETSIEMRIALPPGYPLRNVEVTCTGRLGEGGRWQRWVLQIVHLMSQRDGSVVDAVLLWRRNVDKEFEGAEPCPICYSTLHAKSLCLPSVECSTCHNKFHPTCLYTWFQSSGKSKCVMCQQPFVFSHRRK